MQSHSGWHYSYHPRFRHKQPPENYLRIFLYTAGYQNNFCRTYISIWVKVVVVVKEEYSVEPARDGPVVKVVWRTAEVWDSCCANVHIVARFVGLVIAPKILVAASSQSPRGGIWVGNPNGLTFRIQKVAVCRWSKSQGKASYWKALHYLVSDSQ